METKQKKFHLASAILSVICVVFVAEAAAPVASIGNSQYFWWLFMMVAFLLPYGMISSELGTAYPGDGGLYDWIHKAFPETKWGARASWYYWINFPLWMASLAVVCPELLGVLTGLRFGWGARLLIELAFIWVVTWIACYPVCDSILILNISAAIKMLLALTVGVLGIVYVARSGFVNDMAPRTFLPGFDLHSLSYISVIIFNFLGFEVVCTYADNMRDPKRQIPQAIVSGGIVIALIYLFSAFGIGAAICASIGFVFCFLHYYWTEERNVADTPKEEAANVKFTDILSVFKKNRAFLALCIHGVCICCMQYVGSTLGTYMYSDVLGNIGIMSLASVVSMPLSIVALLIMPKLAEKFGLEKVIRTCLLIGCGLYMGLFAVMMLFSVPAIVYLVWSTMASGIASVYILMQWGLVGEAIDYNELLTGKRTEGSIYGTFNLSRRIGQTVGNSAAVLALGWIGYDANLAAQSAGTLTGIKALCVLVPGIFLVGSWIAFRFVWNITPEIRAKMAAIWLPACSTSARNARADSLRAPWPRMMSCSVPSEVATRTRWCLPSS